MNIGIIFAGGVGTRMRTKEKPKQFLEIYNKPIIIHTLEYFEENENIDTIVVVCVKNWIPYLKSLIYKYRIDKVCKVVPGGASGQESIYNGLCVAKEIANGEKSIVLIHDGVRPLINSNLLTKNIECVKKYGSSITAGIVKETIVIINEEGCIEQVPIRAKSRVAKAPQCFWLHDIFNAHKKAIQDQKFDFIDSCSLMEYYGYKLYMIDGPYENIKITTPDDYYMMRAILQVKEDNQLYGFDEE